MNVLGVPIKLSAQRTIYFPQNYLHAYGIDIYCDCLIRRQHEHHLIFLPYCKRLLQQNEVIVNLRAGSTYITEQWISNNHLMPGKDFLYLVGVNEGLLVSVTPRIWL